MKLCSNNHEEICYQSRICPVCDVHDDMEGMQEEMRHDIDNLAKEIEKLRNEAIEK